MMRLFSRPNRVTTAREPRDSTSMTPAPTVLVQRHVNSDQDTASSALEYHEYSEEHPATTTPQTSKHRGFSTSIAGSFQSLQEERVDACALVCCGVLQSDRDRFLLTGVRPPTCFRRIVTHIVLPISLFILAAFASTTIPDPLINQLVCTTLIFMLVFILIMQCCKGRWKRMKVRKELLWRKYHLAQRNYSQRMLLDIEEDNDDQSVEDDTYLQGQSKCDLSCAHALLGCYITDVVQPSERPNNLCGCLWDALMKACCGTCCGCFLQVCGMCALAQEGREVERLIGIPPIDYLTYQPVLEYAPFIWNTRIQRENDTVPWYTHFMSFSLLSKTLVRNFILIMLGVTLLLSGRERWENLVLVMATLANALIFLGLIHWPYHRMDVSVDALIKYFLSGFLLSTTLAISWEIVLALLLRAILSVVFALSGIDVAYDDNGYQQERNGMIGFGHGFNLAKNLNYHDYLQAFCDEHPVFRILYLLFATYCVAALVEEVCKYFGYRMVDHVDVWSNEHVEKAVTMGIPEGYVEHEEAHYDPPPSQNNNNNTEDHHHEQEQHISDKSIPDVQIEAPKRTLKSLGAATTVSMVAVGLGFECCENLVYMFLYYHDADFAGKLGLLILRALFPLHAIVAAIQSIGVCRRDLEGESSHQLGRILFPSVIIHGTFDFVLMVLDSMPEWAIMEWALAVLIVVVAIVYYFQQSIAQRGRLEQLDHANHVDQSNLL